MSTSTIWIILLAAAAVLLVRRTIRMKSLRHLLPSELPVNPAKDASIILLDVRTGAERNSGSIPGSIHIPLQELGKRMEELGKYRNRTIICYCQSGSRSVHAALRIAKAGYTAVNLKGGIAEWNFSRLQPGR